MAVMDSQPVGYAAERIGGKQRGKQIERWPDRVDQQYLARLVDEGRLTRRDIALFDWLTDVRCATAEQISRVFFSSEGTAKNRLTTLYKLRLLERSYMPGRDAVNLEISPYALVYYVGRGGRYWLNQMEGRSFESGWKVLLPQQIAHDLMSTELVTALYEDFRRLDESTGTMVQMRLESEVVFWKLDAAGKPELRKVTRKGETSSEKVPLLRSDMRFEARPGDDDHAPTLLAAFIEADRGTMNQSQFAEKVVTYNQAAEQWRSREAKGDGAARPFPQVLVVTTGAARARHLAQTISEQAAEGVVWAVLDWPDLRGVNRVLTDPFHGDADKMKLTLIGKPGKIIEKGEVILTSLQGSKALSLPKGLPTPPAEPTTCLVFIAAKQWRKVKAALDADPADRLVIEGYPVLDRRVAGGTMCLYAQSVTTTALQRAKQTPNKSG